MGEHRRSVLMGGLIARHLYLVADGFALTVLALRVLGDPGPRWFARRDDLRRPHGVACVVTATTSWFIAIPCGAPRRSDEE